VILPVGVFHHAGVVWRMATARDERIGELCRPALRWRPWCRPGRADRPGVSLIVPAACGLLLLAVPALGQGKYFQPEDSTTLLALQASPAEPADSDATAVSSSSSPALLHTTAPQPSLSGPAVAVSEPACGTMAASLVLLVFMARRARPVALGP
jgi:hypothetical protein